MSKRKRESELFIFLIVFYMNVLGKKNGRYNDHPKKYIWKKKKFKVENEEGKKVGKEKEKKGKREKTIIVSVMHIGKKYLIVFLE